MEIEISEDEEYFTEEEDEPLPTVSKPLGIDVVQGSLSGAEFSQFKTDSKPLQVAKEEVPIIRKVKVKKVRRVKKKKMIKKS